MRLIRLGEPVSKVADDIRASLTALGRGDATAGGIALVDVTPTGSAYQFDAVLVMPFGIVIAAGVDLPGPALRLEAPLRGQWKADNWPLVGSSQAVNPASAALTAADELARRLNTLTNMAIPVGLVLAVGPFVDNVVTVPPRGEAVRVLYPTPARLRDAIGSLAPDDGRPCSVEQARAVLRLVDAELPIQSDDALAKEGFATGAAHVHAGAQSAQPALADQARTTPTQAPAPQTAAVAKAAALAAARAPERRPGTAAPGLDERPTELMQLPLSTGQPEPQRRGPELKLLPIAAVLLIVAGLIAAIVMATSSGADDRPSEKKSAQQAKPTRYAISGIEYREVAAAVERACDAHTYGDVQAALQKTPCTGMRLGSYLASVSGKQAAVSVAVVEFANPAQASKLKKLADRAGSGGAADVANMRQRWPDGTYSFHNAVYRSEVSENAVRLVRTAWIGEQSSPDDDVLARIAETAFDVPLTD